MLTVHLIGQVGSVESKAPKELGIELALDGSHRHVATIGSSVDLVEVCTGIEHVGASLFAPEPRQLEGVRHRHQRRSSIDHRCIDHLTNASSSRLEKCRRHPEGEQHPAAAEVTDKVQRRDGRVTCTANGPKCSSDRDVVDVMPGAVAKRTILAPARHPSVDERRIDRQELLGPEAQALCDARTKALDEHIGIPDEILDEGDRIRVLEVDAHRGPRSIEQIPVRRAGRQRHTGPLQAEDICTGISQQHAAVGRWSDPCQLDDLDAAERSGHVGSPFDRPSTASSRTPPPRSWRLRGGQVKWARAMLTSMEEPGTFTLPDGFLFGVATAGFQIEGGFNGPAEPSNNWATWERDGAIEASGSATGFYDDFEMQLELAAGIGLSSFRLSVEWSRLEPSEGQWDDAALDHYRTIIQRIGQLGMTPVVTLQHFTHPAWLGPAPWRDQTSAARLAAFEARVVGELGELVQHWVTVNEPNILSVNSFLTGLFPPGRMGDLKGMAASYDTLLAAHVLAYGKIKKIQPQSTVTTNPYTLSLYELDQMATDLLLSRSAGIDDDELVPYLAERRRIHYDRIGDGGSRRVVEGFLRRGSAAQLPLADSFRATRDAIRASDHDGFLDVIAVDHYAPLAASHLVVPGRQSAGGRWWKPGRALWDDEPDPSAFLDVLNEAGSYGKPVWVLENGMCNRRRRDRSFWRMDALRRPRYLAEHLGAVVTALRSGVDVQGFWHWTLIDNYEWGSYEPCFGLFSMDRARGMRISDHDAQGDDAAGAYAAIITGLRSGDTSLVIEPEDKP